MRFHDPFQADSIPSSLAWIMWAGITSRLYRGRRNKNTRWMAKSMHDGRRPACNPLPAFRRGCKPQKTNIRHTVRRFYSFLNTTASYRYWKNWVKCGKSMTGYKKLRDFMAAKWDCGFGISGKLRCIFPRWTSLLHPATMAVKLFQLALKANSFCSNEMRRSTYRRNNSWFNSTHPQLCNTTLYVDII